MSAAQQLSLLSRYDARTLEQRWRAWIAENEHVYRLFVRFTLEAIAAGHQHYSADAIVHRIRWHTGVETRGSDFKIDNSFVALLSRRFAADHHEHAGFFRMRERKS
jgi:hypothetical protein